MGGVLNQDLEVQGDIALPWGSEETQPRPGGAKGRDPQSGTHMAVSTTHLALGPAEGDLQAVHGLDHGPHGHEDVLVDEWPEALAVLLRVTGPVDDAHLLNERALPALAGACRVA